MATTLRNEVERDVGLCVVIETDGHEVGRMSMEEFMASEPMRRARGQWLVELHVEAERANFEERCRAREAATAEH